MFKFFSNKKANVLEFPTAEARDQVEAFLARHDGIEALQSKFDAAQAELTDVKGKLTTAEGTIASHVTAHAELTAKNTELTGQLTTANTNLTEANTKLGTAEKSLTEANAKLEAIASKGGKPAPIEADAADLTPGSKGDTLLDAVKAYMTENKCDRATAMIALAKSKPALFPKEDNDTE